MKKINYLFSTMSLLALTACSSDDAEEYGKDLSTARQIVPVTQISEVSSRASQGLQSTSISKDVKVRFLVTEANSTTISNQSLLTSNGSNGFSESTTNLYYPVSGSADIYGYAPATSTEITDLTAGQTFEIQTDQSSDENYLASDLLFGSKKEVATPTDENSYVVVTFKHALAKINLNIEESLKPATVKISNTKTACTFNISTGAVTATGNAGSVTAATLSGSETATDGYYQFSAIIIPQEFSTEATMLEITTTGGDTYTYTPSSAITAVGATEYTYKVTTTSAAKQVAMTLQSAVTDWTSTEEKEAQVVKAERTAHVGDWYTAEGKYVDGETTAPSNAIGVVFNTTDVPSGYQAYVCSFIDKANTGWAASGSDLLTTAVSSDNFVATGSTAVATRNGSTLTNLLLDDGYNFKSTLSSFTSTYSTPSTSTGWFVPSVGELVLLAQSIYGGTVSGDDSEAKMTVSSATAGYDNSMIQSRIASALTAGLFTTSKKASYLFLNGGSVIQEGASNSNPVYWTISEVDASTVWTVTLSQTKAFAVQTQAKSETARRTHPILLAK